MAYRWSLSAEEVRDNHTCEARVQILTTSAASLEGHFDAPSYKKAEKETEKTNKIPLDQLKPGPSFAIDFGANMNEIVELHERDLDVRDTARMVLIADPPSCTGSRSAWHAL